MVIISDTIRIVKEIHKKIKNNNVSGFLLISIGLFVLVTAANLDMANHWLGKPETFFSPPHAAVYTGVGIMIFGSIWTLTKYVPHIRQTRVNNSNADYQSKSNSMDNFGFARSYFKMKMLRLSIKLIFYGVIILILAGPFDLTWHTVFGLDGLLSPSHATFRIGQALCGIGALLGIVSTRHSTGSTTQKIQDQSMYSIFIIISITALWRVIGGFISMVTLPFSNTYYFEWNPDPFVAAVIATIAFPFFISLMLYCSFRLANFSMDDAIEDKVSNEVASPRLKFGILTSTGLAYLAITVFTAILPNKNLLTIIPFYLLILIPIAAIDIMLTTVYSRPSVNNNSKRIAEVIAGAVLGVLFFAIQYPYITYTYNEVMDNPETITPYNVNMMYNNIAQVLPLITIPTIISGIFGIIVGSNLVSGHKPRQLVKSK